MTGASNLSILTESEAQALPAGDLRTALLSAFRLERQADSTRGWDKVPFTAAQLLKTRQRKPRPEIVPIVLADPGTAAELLHALAARLEQSPRMLATLIQPNMTYLGVMAMHEAWARLHQPVPGLPPDLVGQRVELRFATGVIRDGSHFMLLHFRGHPPYVSVGINSTGLGAEIGGAAFPGLNRLHVLLGRAYDPDAEIIVMPPPDAD